MLVDAHAHIDRYDLLGPGAAESAMAEIERHGILTISNSMDLSSYERNLELARTCDLVLPIFGVHPWHAPQVTTHLKDLEQATEQSPMLGEIGLDHHFVQDPSAYPAQRQVFEFFLAAGSDQEKIVHLHTKGAEEQVLTLLDRYEPGRVVVHWYSGPLDILDEMVNRDFYFTVGLEVRHSEQIRTIAQRIPANRLLTETDNPGGPKGFLGGPGMPALIEEVVRGLAAARNARPEEIVRTVQANWLALIGDDPRLSELKCLLASNHTPFEEEQKP